MQTPFPMPTRPWAEHTQTNLFTPCKHCRWEKTKYAKLRPANIHLARWDQINDIENNEDGGGLVQYFRGRKRQQTRVGIVWLASCLSVSVILLCNVNKDFWLWGSNCSNVVLNKLMVWSPNSHDLLIKTAPNPSQSVSCLLKDLKYFRPYHALKYFLDWWNPRFCSQTEGGFGILLSRECELASDKLQLLSCTFALLSVSNSWKLPWNHPINKLVMRWYYVMKMTIIEKPKVNISFLECWCCLWRQRWEDYIEDISILRTRQFRGFQKNTNSIGHEKLEPFCFVFRDCSSGRHSSSGLESKFKC